MHKKRRKHISDRKKHPLQRTNTSSPCWRIPATWILKVKVTQSCLTLCNLMDYAVHGIFQTRILEWVAFPFSRSSQPRDQTQISHIAGRFFTSWATREALMNLQFSHSVVSDSLPAHESQHARSPCPSPTPRVHSESCPSSQWCHPAISPYLEHILCIYHWW